LKGAQVPRGTAHAPAPLRRAEILQAALRCFAERGYYETTVDHIALRSGLSKGSLYWHFRGKREIFLALLERYEELLARYRAEGEAGTTGEDALRRISGLALRDAPDALQLVEITLEYLAQARRDAELRARLSHLYASLRELLAEQLRRGAADGSFRALDQDAVAAMLAAAMDGLLVHKAVDPGVDLARAWNAALEVFLRGLAP
jgi:AcrR family transcriptional regulator